LEARDAAMIRRLDCLWRTHGCGWRNRAATRSRAKQRHSPRLQRRWPAMPACPIGRHPAPMPPSHP